MKEINSKKDIVNINEQSVFMKLIKVGKLFTTYQGIGKEN